MNETVYLPGPDLRTVDCPTCEAAPGERCRNMHIEHPYGVHVQRSIAWYKANRA